MGLWSKIKIGIQVATQVAPLVPGKAGRVLGKGLKIEQDAEDLAAELKKKPAAPTKPEA